METIPYELSIYIKTDLTAHCQLWSLAYLIAKGENNRVFASVVYFNE